MIVPRCEPKYLKRKWKIDGAITIQDEPIKYDIPKDLLDYVNSYYDGKDLMAAIGGMIHQKYPDQEYRKQRCIEIYGKLI